MALHSLYCAVKKLLTHSLTHSYPPKFQRFIYLSTDLDMIKHCCYCWIPGKSLRLHKRSTVGYLILSSLWPWDCIR